ncbi:gamma-glutamylcyclotransferase family protein [Planococcus sp. 1R117A]|uniref:gamma-glutamylcyclotransferase family protein n=1 Tax=Planococcus sp. 1R117A TaxID=3447020 RepID=UPI003EDBBA0E
MLLFVYGTLKRGGKYHDYLGEAELVAEHAVAKGELYDTGLGYPAMTLSEQGEIHGEVYYIPKELWPAIDYLEDYTGGAATDLFNKVTIEVETEGKVLQSAVYIAASENLLKRKLETGNWDVAVTV